MIVDMEAWIIFLLWPHDGQYRPGVGSPQFRHGSVGSRQRGLGAGMLLCGESISFRGVSVRVTGDIVDRVPGAAGCGKNGPPRGVREARRLRPRRRLRA
jgi:hypothetical protein